MPEKETLRRARRDKRQGKAPTTQAGEFIREEFHHIREGRHGARSPEQAIAIGLSKARRAGVKVGGPRRRKVSAETREAVRRDTRAGRSAGRHRVSPKRSRATRKALKDESRAAASPRALAEHARKAARRRSPTARHRSALQAARTRRRTQAGRPTRRSARASGTRSR